MMGMDAVGLWESWKSGVRCALLKCVPVLMDSCLFVYSCLTNVVLPARWNLEMRHSTIVKVKKWYGPLIGCLKIGIIIFKMTGKNHICLFKPPESLLVSVSLYQGYHTPPLSSTISLIDWQTRALLFQCWWLNIFDVSFGDFSDRFFQTALSNKSCDLVDT